jgi:uncharacterized protein
MKILAVSDIVTDWIYSPRIRQLFSDTDLVLSCGDLPEYYLEYIISTLDKPLLHVRGNHSIPESNENNNHSISAGAINIHCKVMRYAGYSFAGVEGSLRYNDGVFQYSQTEMWLNTFRLIPGLLFNRIKFGRYINVFVTHAPPSGIHDQADLAHQGINAFRWFISIFQPDYHLHGHVHVYRPDTVRETTFGRTKVINTFGYRSIDL